MRPASLSIVMLAMLIASAMYVVRVQYQSRRLVTELDRAVAEGRSLDTERGRLEVEKRAEATSLRVETLARERLAMRTVTPAITEYVSSRHAMLGASAPAEVAPAAAQAASAPQPAEGQP